MQQFENASAGDIVLSLADRIIENRAYLSEIDGKIGDGDHGVNMAKGFGMAAERIRGNDMSLATALDTLGTVLMTEIGGSMGPLYGVMFTQFAETIEKSPAIDAKTFSAMLQQRSRRHPVDRLGQGRRQDAARHARPGHRGLRRAPTPTASRSRKPWMRWSSRPRKAATAPRILWRRLAGPAASANARSASSMPGPHPVH